MAREPGQRGAVGNGWPAELAARAPLALAGCRRELADDILALKVWQFEFCREWQARRAYCRARGVRIMGDLPIYVAHDSADVWAHPDLFYLDAHGSPSKLSGVPPDYFSATGQLWGNPLYRWDLMRQSGYAWWSARFRASLRLFDIVRLDHFRGFEAYWEVPAGEATALHGRWVKGPGAEFFAALQAKPDQVHPQESVAPAYGFFGEYRLVPDGDTILIHPLFIAKRPPELGSDVLVGFGNLRNLNISAFHLLTRAVILVGKLHQRLGFHGRTITVLS